MCVGGGGGGEDSLAEWGKGRSYCLVISSEKLLGSSHFMMCWMLELLVCLLACQVVHFTPFWTTISMSMSSRHCLLPFTSTDKVE